jgi:hypothetical protein
VHRLGARHDEGVRLRIEVGGLSEVLLIVILIVLSAAIVVGGDLRHRWGHLL